MYICYKYLIISVLIFRDGGCCCLNVYLYHFPLCGAVGTAPQEVEGSFSESFAQSCVLSPDWVVVVQEKHGSTHRLNTELLAFPRAGGPPVRLLSRPAGPDIHLYR